MAISRKKAVDTMAKVYGSNHARYQLMLMKEDMTANDLFKFREHVITEIQRGENPLTAIDNMVETAIRTTLLERRMSNAYNPQLRDVLTDEIRAELQKLN